MRDAEPSEEPGVSGSSPGTVGKTVRYASLSLRIPERHWNAKVETVRKSQPFIRFYEV